MIANHRHKSSQHASVEVLTNPSTVMPTPVPFSVILGRLAVGSELVTRIGGAAVPGLGGGQMTGTPTMVRKR